MVSQEVVVLDFSAENTGNLEDIKT